MTSRRQPPMVSRMIRQDASALRFARALSPSLLALVAAAGLAHIASTALVGGVIVAGGAQGAANSAVQSQGTISPTIRVRMGEPIRVFTARDLDFSTAG